jgi:Na+-driven multidrug efflux pump
MGLAVVALASLLLLLLRRHAAALFTTDPAVLEACSGLMLPLAALLISELGVAGVD